MIESKDKDKGENKILKIKTFTVPSSLQEIQENMNINTNVLPKLSKEKIINKAFWFHSQGNTLEAEKYYKCLINLGDNDYRVFSNYGTILKDLGKLKEAAILLRKAIEIEPNFAEGYYNLGNILRDLGDFQEAMTLYKKALNFNKNIDLIKYNLGKILLKTGNLKDGLSYIKKAHGSIIFNYSNSDIIIN